MSRTLILITLTALMLSACVPSANAPQTEPPSDGVIAEPVIVETPNPDQPVSSDDPNPPVQTDYSPQTQDKKLVRGNAFIDSTEIFTMESFPLQFSLKITGSLPNPCHQLRITVAPPDDKNQVMIDVYSVSNPDQICVEMLKEFEVNVPLGSFPTGKYTIIVNGQVVGEIQS